jgi:hypothetical protein
MTANRHQVAGTVQLTSTGNTTVLTLWNKTYNDKFQKDITQSYKLWMNVPSDWTEGTFVEVVGELTMRPATNIDGTLRTYLNAKGETVTAHDLNLNNVEVLSAKIKTGADTTGIDMDDVRKYGTPLQQTIMDDSPF